MAFISTPPTLLPTLPGMVHGIVGRDPWVVQCDGCGGTETSEHLILAVHYAEFNPRLYGKGDRRRLCDDCAHEARVFA